VDTIRSFYGQTSVAPYAIRARRGTPMAAPLEWEDLNDKDIDAQYYRRDTTL
jgi:bifunctional non-homologous end joining protein LigD